MERDLESVNGLTELFLEMREATEPPNYWERWNIDREMSENYGVAMTGMAIHTWLLRFYCAALIWLFEEQDTIENLRDRNPANNPLTEYERVQTDVNGLVETLNR